MLICNTVLHSRWLLHILEPSFFTASSPGLDPHINHCQKGDLKLKHTLIYIYIHTHKVQLWLQQSVGQWNPTLFLHPRSNLWCTAEVSNYSWLFFLFCRNAIKVRFVNHMGSERELLQLNGKSCGQKRICKVGLALDASLLSPMCPRGDF